MPCGCLAGTYQSGSDEAIEIVDAAATSCSEGHDLNLVLGSDSR
jgi:hypothetical protein